MKDNEKCPSFMRQWIRQVTALASGSVVLIATSLGTHATNDKPPLALKTLGHFFAGGVIANRTSTEPVFPGGPNLQDQKILINQGYVDFLIPTKLHKDHAPIIFVHSSINGTIWQTTPDGREGFDKYFARRGFATYVIDPPGVGRASFHDIDQINAAATGRSAPLATNPLSRSDSYQWTQWNVGPTFPQLGDGHTSGNKMANDLNSQKNWLAQAAMPRGGVAVIGWQPSLRFSKKSKRNTEKSSG